MFKSHPKGFNTLFFVEMWERFGFYTMMAVLTLFMLDDFIWSEEKVSPIFGFFVAAVYIFPILGGIISDRWLGQKNSIRVGAFIAMVGYFSLVFSSPERMPMLFVGLTLVAFGTGLFKPNINALRGNLYTKDNQHLKDNGFNIAYMGVNIGAAISPWAALLLRQAYNKNTESFIKFGIDNYHACFALAGIGMIVALIVSTLGQKKYDYADSIHLRKNLNKTSANQPKHHTEIPRSEYVERLITLSILFAIAMFFWVSFYQNGTALTFFAKYSTKEISWLTPEVYQTFNPIFIVTLTPLLIGYLAYLTRKGKNLTAPDKIMLGFLAAGLAPLVMAIASYIDKSSIAPNSMSPLWLIGTYFMVTIAEILISPLGMSYVSKVAPPSMGSSIMGLWLGATGVGSLMAGLFASFYNKLDRSVFFLIIMGLLLLSAAAVAIFKKKLNKFA
ncbi:peptide MFS transporter [Acidobacteriota bacterium]